jgi:hypothetical protein
MLINNFIHEDQLWYSSRRTIEEEKNLNIETKDLSKNEFYHCFEQLDIILGTRKLISCIPEGLCNEWIALEHYEHYL